MADIAAGNGRGSGLPGVAPEADIVFVDASHADIPFDGPEVVGSSFGDSVRLLEAVQYILNKAGDRPCAINISLGTNGGPHDGTTLVEEGIDRVLRQKPNRAVTIAASNSFSDGIHAAGRVAENGSQDLTWEVPAGDISHNEMEIWYSGCDRFAIELIAPGGSSLGTVKPGRNGIVRSSDGRVPIFVANRLGDPNNGDNMIGIFLDSGLPTGQWVVRLHGETVKDGSFHAWIERDNQAPSRFAPPHDDSHTIGSISCGRETVVVGSFDAHKASRPISFFSSAGPTRDGRRKPEISAPGHAVFAAKSGTRTGVVRKSGTSMAAPAVCGSIALLLAEACKRGVDLTIEQIRGILVQTAQRNPPDGKAWHPQYGNGRVSAAKAVATLIEEPQQAAAASTKKKRKAKAKTKAAGR